MGADALFLRANQLLLIEGDGSLQPFLKAHLGFPAQPLLRLAGIRGQLADAGHPISNKSDSFRSSSEAFQHSMRILQRRALPFWTAANIEGFAHHQPLVCVQEQIERAAKILDIEPLMDMPAITMHF